MLGFPWPVPAAPTGWLRSDVPAPGASAIQYSHTGPGTEPVGQSTHVCSSGSPTQRLGRGSLCPELFAKHGTGSPWAGLPWPDLHRPEDMSMNHQDCCLGTAALRMSLRGEEPGSTLASRGWPSGVRLAQRRPFNSLLMFTHLHFWPLLETGRLCHKVGECQGRLSKEVRSPDACALRSPLCSPNTSSASCVRALLGTWGLRPGRMSWTKAAEEDGDSEYGSEKTFIVPPSPQIKVPKTYCNKLGDTGRSPGCQGEGVGAHGR